MIFRKNRFIIARSYFLVELYKSYKYIFIKYHQIKHQHGSGLHGVRRGSFTRSNQQEINQRNMKHAIENMLADELQVKPSNRSTLELLVSELKPLI